MRFNREAVMFQLIETKNAIDAVIEHVHRGEYDGLESMAMSADFKHILIHLCSAWHSKWMDQVDLQQLNDVDYEDMFKSVPNWALSFILVDVDEPKKFDMRDEDGVIRSGQKKGTSTINLRLRRASDSLE